MKVERPARAGLFACADVRDAVRRRGAGRRRMRRMVHGRCVQTLRPGAPARVGSRRPWLSVRLLWLEPSWLWRLPILVASAIAPEPVASVVANAVVSAITQRRFFRARANSGGIRRFNEDSREGAQAR